MKKGFAGVDMIQWMLRLIFLTVVVFSCVLLIRMYIKSDVNIFEAETDLFYKRVLYSPDGIMYKDYKINRAYPGIIDLERFRDGTNITEDMIVYGAPNNYIAAKFTLRERKRQELQPYEFYYNKNGYTRWKPFADLGIEGIGGADSIKKEILVLVYEKKEEGGTLENDILEVDIVSPRS